MSFKNVLEPWPIYDTLVVGPNLYGPECTVPGWFTTMGAFGARQDHLFFKGRTEALCGLAYNNQQQADKTDFAFHAASIGLRFFGPATNQEYDSTEASTLLTPQDVLAPFWQWELPNHVGVEFRVAQDVKYESMGFLTPPGYGPRSQGSSLGVDADSNPPYGLCTHITAGTQGVPFKENRFQFEDWIPIPRNEVIEVTVWLSEYARYVLTSIAGPGAYGFHSWGGEGSVYLTFGMRYGIQCSLYGLREVQQRGELHI
jgi:hypothetical protein